MLGKRIVTIDIIVPSFRAPHVLLQNIIDLEFREDELSRSVIIVFDNSASKLAVDVMKRLESRHHSDPFVRLRMK